jgi:hypothetical protein
LVYRVIYNLSLTFAPTEKVMDNIEKNFLWVFLGMLLALAPGVVTAQYKFEKETHIEREQAPLPAVAFIDSCFIKKAKWFREESQSGMSIEAKAKLGGYLYSIEFDTLGKIQDVEKKVPFEELDMTVKQTIQSELQKHFRKYSIKKTQIQWEATNPTLQVLMKTGLSTEEYNQQFEIIIKGKQTGPKKYYEVLFDRSGKLLEIFEIVERPTSHLDF